MQIFLDICTDFVLDHSGWSASAQNVEQWQNVEIAHL